MAIIDDFYKRYEAYLESKRKYESLSPLAKGMMRLRGSYEGVNYIPTRPDFDEVGNRRCITYSSLKPAILERKVVFQRYPFQLEKDDEYMVKNQAPIIPRKIGGSINDLWTVIEYLGNSKYKDLLTGYIYTIDVSLSKPAKFTSNNTSVNINLGIVDGYGINELTGEIGYLIENETRPRIDEVIKALKEKDEYASEQIRRTILANREITLLSKEQVFGEKRLSIFDKIGTKCSLTDFSVLYDPIARAIYSSKKDKPARWALSSDDNKGGVFEVDDNGDSYRSSPSIMTGVRPVIADFNFSEVMSNAVRGENGVLEVEYGEYPQYAVDADLAEELDSRLSSCELIETGKYYHYKHRGSKECSKIIEFGYNEKKYVRFEYVHNVTNMLSNGVTVGHEKFETSYEYVWLEVSPITWYVDEISKLLISKSILLAEYFQERCYYYNGHFENTEMYMFLNNYFAKDIIPSNNNMLTQKRNIEQDNNSLDKQKDEIATDEKDTYEDIAIKSDEVEEEYIEDEDEKEAILKKVRKNPESFKTIDEKYRKDFDVALEAVIMDGLLLEFFSEKLKSNEKIVKSAIESNPLALEFASSIYKNDFDTVMYCVKRCGMTLKFASPKMKKEREIVLEAVKQDARAIKFADNEIFKEGQNKDIVMLAVRNDGQTLKYVLEFKNDREVVLEAVKQNALSILYADKRFWDDEEIVLMALSQRKERRLIRIVSKRLTSDLKFMKKLCEIDKYFINYAEDNIKDILRIELALSNVVSEEYKETHKWRK